MDTYNMIDFNEKKGFICDMDGVIYHGNRVLPGVAEFIQWLHDENKEYLFLTNNSGYTPRELSQKLARMGLDVTEEHFYTSALATAAFLRDQAPGCSVFAIGEAGLLNALYDAGITMNDVNPDYVVVGEGRSYSLDTLTKATNLVWKGAKLIGANSDVSGPIENGIVPACRALVAPIEMATGTQAYFCGKPNPLMMRTGLRMLHCHSAEAVMVGDRMDTDVISGMESGMSTVLVLSGVSTRETIKTYAYRPSMVLNGVGDIVSFTGGKHYTNANAATGTACKPGKAKVTQVYQPGKAKHPYHLVAVSGGGSTVYGWVDAADIGGSATGGTRTHTVVRGDTLWALASTYLGSGSRYKEIMRLNGLTSEIIHVGQVLKMPAK